MQLILEVFYFKSSVLHSKIYIFVYIRIPRLLEVVMGIGLSAPKVITAFNATFLRLCQTFGKTFVHKKVCLYIVYS